LKIARRLHRPRLGSVAIMALVVAAFSGLSTSAAQAAPASAVGRLGHLEVINAFLPDPASPSVAAVYLTVENTGNQADELVSASSPVASTSMLMTENDHGSTGSMSMLRELRIPAHGRASLIPGHDHVMLEQPNVQFKVGQTVLVTLRFEKAGSITIKVPVVPLSRILGK
jgi:periplasmic copper chaperone A